MPRFVVLEHDHPVRHWDFLLEDGEVLRAWRLSSPPGPDVVAVESSFDHRLLYLDYEGPVRDGRGRVVRWDAGAFTWEVRDADCVVARLEGGRLRGVFRMEQSEDGTWRGRFTAAAPS